MFSSVLGRIQPGSFEPGAVSLTAGSSLDRSFTALASPQASIVGVVVGLFLGVFSAQASPQAAFTGTKFASGPGVGAFVGNSAPLLTLAATSDSFTGKGDPVATISGIVSGAALATSGVTQSLIEVATHGEQGASPPGLIVTQDVIEWALHPANNLEITQVCIEVAYKIRPTGVIARYSQALSAKQ